VKPHPTISTEMVTRSKELESYAQKHFGKLHKRKAESPIVSIQQSSHRNAGKGLFAEKQLDKGFCLCEYAGEFVPKRSAGLHVANHL
jgi:hypothetical protein